MCIQQAGEIMALQPAFVVPLCIHFRRFLSIHSSHNLVLSRSTPYHSCHSNFIHSRSELLFFSSFVVFPETAEQNGQKSGTKRERQGPFFSRDDNVNGKVSNFSYAEMKLTETDLNENHALKKNKNRKKKSINTELVAPVVVESDDDEFKDEDFAFQDTFLDEIDDEDKNKDFTFGDDAVISQDEESYRRSSQSNHDDSEDDESLQFNSDAMSHDKFSDEDEPHFPEKDKYADFSSVQDIQVSPEGFEISLSEILASITQDEVDYEKRKAAIRYIQSLIQSRMPDATVVPFGSFATGLSSRNADLDLQLIAPRKHACRKIKSEQYQAAREMLKARTFGRPRKMHEKDLRRVMIQMDTFESVRRLLMELHKIFQGKMKNVTSIPLARVPIVDFVTKRDKIEVDIAISDPSCILASEIIRQMIEKNQTAKNLILLVKYWAKKRSINDGAKGYLNSHGYTLLVICFLQQRKCLPLLDIDKINHVFSKCSFIGTYPPEIQEIGRLILDESSIDDPAENTEKISTDQNQNLHMLIRDFFNWLSEGINFRTHIVSVRKAGLVPVRDMKEFVGTVDSSGGPRIFIQDVANPMLNVARTLISKDNYRVSFSEFQRASKMINSLASFEEICEERKTYKRSKRSSIRDGGSGRGGDRGGRRRGEKSEAPRHNKTKNYSRKRS